MRKNEATNLGSMPRLFANKVGDIAVSAGSWVYPPFYRIQCERLQDRTNETLQREKRIVVGLGELILGASTGRLNVDRQDFMRVSEAIKPNLRGVGYHTVFDPHTAGVLEKVAPLTIDNNK